MTQRKSAARRGSHRGGGTKWIRSHRSFAACLAVIIAAALVVTVVKLSAANTGTSDPHPGANSQQPRYLGVFEPDAPNSYSQIEQFAHDVGRQPNLVSYYSGWGEGFQRTFAETAARHGATTLLQIDPTNISLAQIAAGTYDYYVTSLADQIAAFPHQVVISFGHEMNGFWETWGYHHTPPADFVAAWRHIVDVFRQRSATNVTWLWQVNSSSALTGPVRDWWPGSQYVNWVGVSGYYYLPGNTFDNVFTPVVTAVRKFTQAPLLIAETAVGPDAGQPRGIQDLFAGLRAQHYLGLVWFDEHSYGGLYKGENWRLEENQGALDTFRSALRAPA